MKDMTLKEVENAVGGKIILGDDKAIVSKVSTDSRKVTENSLFFPLKGKKHDGHKFIKQVYDSGCKNIIVSNELFATEKDMNLIKVADTTKALQDLAAYTIKKMKAKVIGVTGSVGKTSTKDMIYFICSQKYKTGKTEGNFNNEIGLPLTILRLEEDTQVIVLEMGMDHFGEIDLLAKIAKPDIGAITNIGISHIENLGSREGIMKAKMEITNYFGPDNVLVISTGEDFLRKEHLKGQFNVITTGIEKSNDYVITNIEENNEKGLTFTLNSKNEKQRINLPIPGKHNVLNGALAVAVGNLINISMKEAAKGLEIMELTSGRLTIKEANGVKVIDDTYNASPDSMKAAINILAASKEKEKIAVLGDMFELGKKSKEWHQDVGLYARKKEIDKVIAIGDMAKEIAKGAGEKGIYFSSKEKFNKKIPELVSDNSAVLVKGSRGMKMEEIVKAIIEQRSKNK